MIASTLFFALLLGMKHGIDPDHLTIINGISLNQENSIKTRKWNGLYFSLGHGLAVTIIGLLWVKFSSKIMENSNLLNYTEWLPIIILLFTGIWGIKNLIQNKNHEHKHILNYKVDLNTKTAPLQLFVTGLVFALVFDTTTQITAWGLIEGQSNQYAKALYIGLAFTLGMILTDTLNSFLFVKILILNRTKMNFNNILAILIIISSLLFALLQTMNKLGMEFELSDTSKLIFGITTLAITLSITVYYSFIKPRIKL